ncbi:MAG: hypothetical protein LCH62_06050 [Proteobacteria bacterium]|nr:hypothetical protein [Pseudomonadota bacterium]
MNSSYTQRKLCLAAGVATFAMLSSFTAAQAQDVDDGNDIIVTATKRATSIQNVPFSINAQTEKAIERANAKLPQPERVRRFLIATQAFTIENEQMTPTLKVRRHIVRGVYGDRLEALYG